MSVTIDSSSLRYCPATSAEWDELLAGTGIASPSSFWLCQESSGSLVDSGTGGRNITLSGSFNYRAAATGWTRTGIVGQTVAGPDYGEVTIPNVNANSALMLQMYVIETPIATGSSFVCWMDSTNYIGSYISIGNKLISRGGALGASLIYGDIAHPSTVIVVSKLDHSRSEFATYTSGEKLTPTWTAPSSDTTMRILGDGAVVGGHATLVYAAFWTGSDAEMSDAQVQSLLDTLEGDMMTLDAMSAGSMSYKTVVAIEGCEYLLSDAPSQSVLDAWNGYDFTSALGGLYVNVQNSQRIDPDQPFAQHGRCTIRAIDETGDDTLGELMHKRLVGAESILTETIDNDDTTIKIASSQNFTSSGVAYIGTEAIGYTGKTATSLTGCTRGLHSPFGTATGALRFGNYHRVGPDADDVQLNPIVSQLPRVWLGKRVGVWLHRWNAETQTLNHRREAQLVYAGHITAIGDDANSSATVIELEHASKKLQNVVVGQDLWRATIHGGLYIPEGRVFKFKDYKSSAGTLTANDLEVVTAGTASGTNQMDAGYYYVDEICSLLSAWLAGEKAASRIYGYYRWESPISSNDGPRTKCKWRIEDASSAVNTSFGIEMPGEVYVFLGMGDENPGEASQSMLFSHAKPSNQDRPFAQGRRAPMSLLVFKAGQPGRLAQEFSEATTYDVENEQGEFYDQYASLPAPIKESCDSTKPWGLFLFDEKNLIVASYDDTTGVLANCWLAPAPFQPSGADETASLSYIGRRVDEPERGPVTIRQVLVFEDTWANIFKSFIYSTGTSGYNHATHDTLGTRGSANMPGELFGDEFDRSLDNMPGAELPATIIIEEPTKFTDLFGSDMLVRVSFLRWKNQHFELMQWRTPTLPASVADVVESTKAAPSTDDKPQFRCSSIITSEYSRPVTKFDYGRDFVLGRNDNYQKSIVVKDRTQVDDQGGTAAPKTIKLRNTFAGSTATGSGVEALIADYIATVTMFRPAMTIERSIDQRYFETVAPGDIVAVTDTHARDPLTGARGIDDRPGFVVSTSYTLGGLTSSGKDYQSGRIEIAFLDVQRGETFAPAGEIDETVNSGGFSAGYNSGTPSIRLKEHAYSSDGIVITSRGRKQYLEEAADATHFEADDEILIIEIDPDDPTAPDYWERTIVSVSGNDLVLSSTLSGPAWDANKLYRVVPRKYTEVQGSQQNHAFQADNTDALIEDEDPPYHYSSSAEPTSFTDVTGSEPAEYIPELSYGDGRPYDCGFERAIVHTANRYFDYKSAHQSPFLWNTAVLADFLGSGTTTWNTMFVGPIYLGMDNPTGVITRSLTVAPFWRSDDGSNAYLRITLSRARPMPSLDQGALGSNSAFRDPMYTGEYSQSSVYTTTSTTWATGADSVLSVAVKGLSDGIAWLVIEGAGTAACRGLAKCIEGPRVVG